MKDHGDPIGTSCLSPTQGITRRHAADVTLAVSNEAANLMDWRYWGEPTSVYCRQFVEKMQHVFRERYAGIGARVTGP